MCEITDGIRYGGIVLERTDERRYSAVVFRLNRLSSRHQKCHHQQRKKASNRRQLERTLPVEYLHDPSGHHKRQRAPCPYACRVKRDRTGLRRTFNQVCERFQTDHICATPTDPRKHTEHEAVPKPMSKESHPEVRARRQSHRTNVYAPGIDAVGQGNDEWNRKRISAKNNAIQDARFCVAETPLEEKCRQ